MFTIPTNHGDEGVVNLPKYFLLGIPWNVQICSENSCLPTLSPHGELDQFIWKKEMYFLRIAWNVPFCTEIHVCHPHPYGDGMGWRVSASMGLMKPHRSFARPQYFKGVCNVPSYFSGLSKVSLIQRALWSPSSSRSACHDNLNKNLFSKLALTPMTCRGWHTLCFCADLDISCNFTKPPQTLGNELCKALCKGLHEAPWSSKTLQSLLRTLSQRFHEAPWCTGASKSP